jgi:hypothetical protein
MTMNLTKQPVRGDNRISKVYPRSPLEAENRFIKSTLPVAFGLGTLGWLLVGDLWGASGITILLVFALLLFATAVGGFRAGDDS